MVNCHASRSSDSLYFDTILSTRSSSRAPTVHEVPAGAPTVSTRTVFRSTDGGANFVRLSGNGTSGLPNNSAFDLVGEPGNNQRLYVSTTGGIFRSDDTGATWTNVTGAGAGTPGGTVAGATNNIEMAVHNNAGANAVYVGVVNNGRLGGLFRSADQGANWAQLDTPQTLEGGVPVGMQPREKPGGQGSIHFSILADRTNANLVFLGGDRQPTNPGPDGTFGTNDDTFPNSIGANDFSGRLFRCDASQAAGAQCAVITHVNANGTAPHADSREMVWDANGDIVETDDGGIYRQTDPATNNGAWVSVNGNLQVAESHSCDYDSVANVIMCGNQDTGTPEQTSAGSTTWREVTTADGGTVAIDDVNAAQSIRYLSTQNFGGLRRRTCDAANNCANTTLPLTVAGSAGQNLFQFDNTIQFYGPIEVNAVATGRLLIGTNRLYESTDQGNNITDLTGNTGSGITEALAYGGRSGGVDNPDVLWFGNGVGLSLRTSAGGAFTQLNAYPGGRPIDLVLDRDDWLTAYVTDGTSVFRTDDAGTTWSDITGDLATHDPGSVLSIAFVPGSGFDAVVVGTTRGVFSTQSQNFGRWAEFGAGIPNTLASDVRYDATDDVLMVGTNGRGAWLVSNASSAFPTADVRVSKTDTPDPVIAGEELFYTVTVTNDGPDTAFGVVVSDELPDEVTYLSDSLSPDPCTLNAADNSLSCDLGDIPSGDSRSFTIKTKVAGGAVADESEGTTRIDNKVSVTTASVDPDLSDNTATTSPFVQERADLAVTKLCVPNGPVQAGQTAKCTVFVDNFGPSHARNATVTDTHTSEGSFTIVSATPSKGSCSFTSDTVTCNLGTVSAASPSESEREKVDVEITANEAMDIDDVAKVVSSTPDPDVSNNQRSDTLSFSAVSDLRLTKTGPATAVAGTTITYNLQVINDGPSKATALRVRVG
ncbi:putative repeat protein (TIGR01451 family) [Kribbella sp. VKM Ac-2527]|uniref:Putative repeat protein (TIGR01451 family) n=1 Tax=Kribbella caucasensis TaxID=2512215 RepID=A0A4R6J2Z1_9ACTN|nr:putative repeat protein (TIGR01451 family) [Kribbella sp. VKM Ac-2527]